MATLDDDLANAVTEGFRLAQSSIINQDLILSGTGDVTVTLANGSKKTGPSWSKLITAANAAGTSATAAKTSETNALASKNAAATSATNAATSEGNALASKNAAKTSETNAKTSETNAKTSENNAGASASSAAASLAAAQQLTSVPYEEAPFPDVWAPLNDDLRLLAGSAPYDKLTISGQELELPSKSLTFSRASTATYIDKSGVLRTAAINEPRFERDGLLVEGQSTNCFLNSDDPTKWTTTSSLTKTVLSNDGATQAITMKGVVNAVNAFHSVVTSSNLTLAVGELVTLSCRAKGNYGLVRLAFTLGGSTTAAATFDLVAGGAGAPPAGVTVTTSLGSDGYSSVSATLTVPVAGTYAGVIVLQKAASDNESPIGSEIYVQTIQFEKNPCVTSYIPTSAATATRAADVPYLLASSNCGLDNVTICCTVTRNWTAANVPNTAPRIFSTRGSTPSAAWEGAFNSSANANTFGGVSNSSSAVAGFVDGHVFTSIKTAGGFTTVIPSGKTTGNQVTTPGFSSPLYIGNTKELNRPLFGHIRNLRIWHRALTDNQIRGLR